MESLLIIIGILLVCGIVAGLLAGLLGVGGGFLMVPAMFILLVGYGFEEHAMVTAVATSAAVILPTSMSGTFRQWRMKNIYWHSSLILGIGGIIGSFCGSSVSVIISSHLHAILFVLFLIFLSLWMVISKSWYILRYHLPESVLLFGTLGFFTGVLAGFFGIGGGIILVPVLTTIFGYSMSRSVGISTAAMILIAGGSVFSYIVLGWEKQGLFPYSIGYVNLFFAGILLCTSVPAAQAGVLFSHRIPERMHVLVFVGMLLAIAVKMFFSL